MSIGRGSGRRGNGPDGAEQTGDEAAPTHTDRRHTETGALTRARLRRFWDLVFGTVRLIARHVTSDYAVFGLFLLTGTGIAVLFTWAFSAFARKVRAGSTQPVDDAIMHWVAAHQYPVVEHVMREITSLGTGIVVGMIVLVAGMFLWLNHHRHSAGLLIAATLGGLVLDNLLKVGFNRPRPQIFEWGTHAASSSFPSGHAMSAVVAYGTIAYLAARLQRRLSSRVLTFVFAAVVVALISVSRIYLGVHYPSDIIAGLLIGLAWAGFCMAVLEAAQLYARFHAPQLLAEERPAPPHTRPSP